MPQPSKLLLITLTAVLAAGCRTYESRLIPAAEFKPPRSTMLAAPYPGAGKSVRERRMRLVLAPFTGCPRGNEFVSGGHEALEKEVLNLVNRERAKRSLKKLNWDPRLAAAARYHAADMAAENYFSHDSRDRRTGGLVKSCRTFKRISAFARNGGAENIAAGVSTASAVMRMWMNSPGHRRNILNPSLKYLGVGLADDSRGDYRYYWVQNFGW